jgi:hypothetical protein
VEVDFVVYGSAGFWAVEVKNTGRLRPEDLRSLRSFVADYPECEAVLVYRGEERLRIDDIWCIPGDDFLRHLVPGRGVLDWLHGGGA